MNSTAPVNFKVRIYSMTEIGSTLAHVGVTINDAIAIRQIRIRTGRHSLYVSMPWEVLKNGRRRGVCFPCTKEARAALDHAVLGAYHQALLKQKHQTEEQPASQTAEN